MAELALLGGRPVRVEPFPPYNTLGEAEKRAVAEVMDSSCLSDFLAAWGPKHLGGPRVRTLEAAWAEHFGVKHAVAMNSATSALYAAMGAAGVGPGDEVVVSPYTMVASVTCALVFNAVPVFADIDPETFCISPRTIEAVLSPRTKAIAPVDILGHPADMDPIMELARQRGLVVVEDAAQAYGATYQGRKAGTLGHIGVFSLNYHKTIHTGEGGVAVTDDDNLADRLRLIRNHAEVVVGDTGRNDLAGLVGFNFRLGEIEAAIALEQLKRMPALAAARLANADFLTARLAGLAGLTPPVVKPGVVHGYYLYAIRYDEQAVGVPRDLYLKALQAEGVPAVGGYTKPIYLQPMFQRRMAYGDKGCPFGCPHYQGHVSYERGICPVCERMYFKALFFINLIHAGLSRADMEDVAAAFHKVHANLEELKATA